MTTATASDPHDLQRFVQAQAQVYPQALTELRAGRKRSHWSWFVLPQLRGLGHSDMAERYGISGLDEARAYLAHPLLGARLRECVGVMTAHRGLDAEAILGDIDALKFRSCLTLYLQVAEPGSVFQQALQQYFDGRPDRRTLQLLEDL